MFIVCILRSETSGRHYIGVTSNIDDRLRRHSGNRELSTKYRGPWRLIHFEQYKSRAQAAAREKQIKSYKGGQAFQRLILSSG